jgi:hypothetical protein
MMMMTKVHYRIHKRPSPVPIPSQLNPFHTPTSHFLNIISILSFHLLLGLPSDFIPQVSQPKPFIRLFSPHTLYMSRPSHLSRVYHPHNIGWGVQTTKLLIMYFFLLPCYLAPLSSKYSPQHPSLKDPRPSSSLNERDQVSHPHKITVKVMVLFILIFIFLVLR